MFNFARLQLTAWYLLIIMVISVAFSLAIYHIQTTELERFAQAQRMRIERRLYGLPAPGGPILMIDPQLIEEAKGRLGIFLVVVNGFILVISGGLSFFLAGRTLKPIREMVDEQNRFIGDASHELRTPLTSLKSAMEVNLRDQNLTAREAKALLTDSLEEVNKLQALSEGLLQLAQFQKQEMPKFESVSLGQVVKDAASKIEPLAARKKVVIKDEVGSGGVKGNKYQLEELAVILLDNAVKYSRENGKIVVGSKKRDGTVDFWVADKGVGINRKDIPHIFDRFYRADSARQKTGAGGYGLGLAIAKKIVDTHRGTISVKSKPGQGTMVTVRLPMA